MEGNQKCKTTRRRRTEGWPEISMSLRYWLSDAYMASQPSCSTTKRLIILELMGSPMEEHMDEAKERRRAKSQEQVEEFRMVQGWRAHC